MLRARDGMWFGVLKGMARNSDMDVTALRLVVVVLAIFTAIIPMLIVYLAAAVIMKVEPIDADPPADPPRPRDLDALDRSMDRINQRLQKIEEATTEKERGF